MGCRFLWQEKKDGSLHILYHNGPRGLHAFSSDGLSWRKSPTNSSAFTLHVNYSDGSTIELARFVATLADHTGIPRVCWF